MTLQELGWPSLPNWALPEDAKRRQGPAQVQHAKATEEDIGDDEWDIDVRFDELTGWFGPGAPLEFLPTGADGGTSCDTNANTCAHSCVGTCATCGASCGGTCGATACINETCQTCLGTHCVSCGC